MFTPVKRIFAPPVFAADEDKTRLAALLNTVFLGTIGVGIILGLLMLILHPDPLPHLVPVSAWLLLALSGLVLLRYDQVVVAGLGFTIVTWLFITLVAAISGGIRTPAFASYVAVILLAGLIYGTRVGLVFVGLSIVAGAGILYAELSGSLPLPLLPNNSVTMWAGLVVNFINAAVLVHLATRNTYNALERARRNEMELQATLETLRATLEAQQQSEANFRALADNANDGIAVFVDESHLVYVNQRAAEVSGYSLDELRQLTLTELFPPVEHKQIISHFRQWLAGAQVLPPYETAMVHKKGHHVHLEITAARMVWQGQPAVIAIFRDITTRKESEESLQRTEKRYRELFEEAPAMYAITRNQTGASIIVDCNELFLSTLNYKRAEIIDRPLADLYTPASQAKVVEDDDSQQTLAGHFLVEERQLVARNGSIIETLLRAKPEVGPEGQVVETRAMFVDITERKQMEKSLEQSEKKFRNIVEAMPLGMHLYRLEAGERLAFVGANPAADKILRVDHSQFIGKTIEEAFPALVGTELPEKYRLIAAQGGTWHTEELTYQEGDIAGVFEVHAFQTSPGQMAAAFLDIRTRKRLEKRLATIYQLGQRLTLLQDETAIIQHVLATAAHLLQANLVGCGLIDEDTGELEYHYRVGDSPEIHRKKVSLVEGKGANPDQVGLHTGSDTPPDPAEKFFLGDAVVQTELAVSIEVGSRNLGVLQASSLTPNCFSPTDELLLQTLAGQAAVTLENARLYQKLHQNVEELIRLNTENFQLYQAEQSRYREAEALRRAALALTSTIDLSELLSRILIELQIVIPYDSAAVQLLQQDHLEIIAGQGFTELDMVIGTRIPLREGFSPDYQVISTLKPVIIPDTTTHNSPLTLASVTPATALIRSWLGVPLVFKNRAIGMLTLDKHQPDFYTDTHAQTAQAYAAQAASALENARLYQDLQNQMLVLQVAQAQLARSERMAALGRLMASIAHEINNPLQGIQGFLELLGEELSHHRRQEKINFYLDIANQEIERIASIVHRMREFYRLPTDGPQPAADGSSGFYRIAPHELQVVDLHLILESVLQLANKKLQHNRIGVERVWAENLPALQASPDHLKQVFLNLTLNAIDAMPTQGGTLSIYTGLEQTQLYDSQPQPTVRVEFRDTGAGIPPEVLPRLFEPFLSTKEYGSGLGLFTSYQIITAHHGQITAASQAGQGTIFTILLPLEQPPA